MRAVDAISRNSLGTGAKTLPSETRAARPRLGAGSGAGWGVRVRGSVVVTLGPRPDPLPHRGRETATPVGIGRELVEGCRGGGEKHDVPVIRDPGRQFDDPCHDLISL